MRLILLLGGNIGDKYANLSKAKELINSQIGTIEQVSSIYRSESWGFDGEDFINQVVICSTILDPEAVLFKIWEIEVQFGRQRGSIEQEIEKLAQREAGVVNYENREMDIDILLYGDLILSTDLLTIPHPKLSERLFVLKPLAELISEESLPNSSKTIGELLNEQNQSTYQHSF